MQVWQAQILGAIDRVLFTSKLYEVIWHKNIDIFNGMISCLLWQVAYHQLLCQPFQNHVGREYLIMLCFRITRDVCEVFRHESANLPNTDIFNNILLIIYFLNLL